MTDGLGALPPGFLWGAASSAHQTEGDNIHSNWWFLENMPSTPLTEPSGAAVDSYRRYPEDMRILAEAGLDSYRFSIEWARIEPEAGQIERDQLAHYRRMITTAVDLGLTPVVTLHHFTNPLWFTRAGGWRGDGAADAFARYVGTVAEIVQDVPWVCTINEPNMIALIGDMLATPEPTAPDLADSGLVDTRSVSALALPAPDGTVADILSEAHSRARAILHDRTDAKVGWTVSNQAFEASPDHSNLRDELYRVWEGRFLDVSRGDDFVGVQSYTTRQVGRHGLVPYETDPDTTQTGWPNRPDALGIALRQTWGATGGTPILVTENGVATADDTVRIAYLEGALQALAAAVSDGIDVRGYMHWSALDNYEWGEWGATFGLIEVDRSTFARTPRPSLFRLGDLARAHRASSGSRGAVTTRHG
jgi:beta-glucosidase